MDKLWFFPIFPSVCSSRTKRNAQKLAKSGRSCLRIVLPLIQPPILYTNKAYIPDVSIHCYYIKKEWKKTMQICRLQRMNEKKVKKSVTKRDAQSSPSQRVAEGKATDAAIRARFRHEGHTDHRRFNELKSVTWSFKTCFLHNSYKSSYYAPFLL